MAGAPMLARTDGTLERRVPLVLGAVFTVVFLTPAVVAADHIDRNQNGSIEHNSDNPGHPRGYMYWVDNTGPEWPVYTAAIDWDKAPGVDAVYTTSGASCPKHCWAGLSENATSTTPAVRRRSA